MSEKRLDELVGLLATARPRLNDVTRARVVASIAGTPPTTPIERPGRRARWSATLVSTAGHGRRARWIVAAAAIAALLLYSGAREGAPDPRVMRAVEPSIAHMRAEQESIARIGADQRASEPPSFAAEPESAPDAIALATHSTTYKLNDATVT